ncbi:hypothetical protein [Chryseobacterium gambrini]|uniref:hypothetical protein n=1 Tax=Chryseobacterium gambrini TaxID=373672 RepID=UPI003D0F229D
MAKGGKIISDSFEISSETQVGFSVSGTCQSQDGGYIEVSLENLTTGTTITVCRVDFPPNVTTGNTGFALRLKPGNYKWTSKFTSYTAMQVSKPKQEGNIHIYDELHGEISYGQIGTAEGGTYGTSFFLFSGLGTVSVSAKGMATSNNKLKGILKIKNLTDNSEITSPQILTELNNSNVRTELQAIIIKPYDYYKMTFEIEFNNINSVTNHFMKIISN